jgi:hypothetical protein
MAFSFFYIPLHVNILLLFPHPQTSAPWRGILPMWPYDTFRRWEIIRRVSSFHSEWKNCTWKCTWDISGPLNN